MNVNGDKEGKLSRVERIRAIVREDYARISSAMTSYETLNAVEGEALAQIEERYQRYERFYRVENFQRLGDIELTRKALDIRRALGRAIVEVRAAQNKPRAAAVGTSHDMSLFALDDDRVALSEIYLRDGVAYLRLGDLGESSNMLRRAVEYNPSHGLALAYLGYVLHKHRSFDGEIVEEAISLLERAAEVEPHTTDIHILRGRFFAKLKDTERLQESIRRIEVINPAHPMLDRLQRKLNQLMS